MGAAVFAVAALLQASGQHNGDNSWYYTLCEKLLDGAQAYVDVIETNPPASFLIYLPAAALARLLGVATEHAVTVFVFSGVVASLWLCGAILRGAGLLGSREAGLIRNAALLVLLVIPAFPFAQREHIAMIALLPALCVTAARAVGVAPTTGAAIVAGALAGSAVCIKPWFALAAVAPLACAMIARRSIAPAFGPEIWAAAAALVAYAGATLAFFPRFLDLAPALFDAYTPLREPARVLLVHPWLLLHAGLMAALGVAWRLGFRDPRATALAAASLGFAGAFVLQGKGWANHGLPGVALALLALAILLIAQPAAPAPAARRRLAAFALAPAAVIAALQFGVALRASGWEERPGLASAIQRLAPPRPKLIAASENLSVGHPVTRRVSGRWVGRPASLWLAAHSLRLLAEKPADATLAARLRSYVARDARMFREDVAANAPDAILVERHPMRDALLNTPSIAAALAAYEPLETVGDVQIWLPRSAPRKR